MKIRRIVTICQREFPHIPAGEVEKLVQRAMALKVQPDPDDRPSTR